MTKQTAFHPRLAELTGQWMDLFGYWAPTVVTDTSEEYHAVRRAAGLMDFSMLRKADIDGPGAVGLVNSVVTRDVAKLRPGRIGYGALCDESGKMIDDCTVMLRDRERVRFCGASDRDLEILAAKAQEQDARVAEFTDAMPHLCVQGPGSREILAPLANKDMSAGAFPYYSFREDMVIAGVPVFMTRMGYTAELGYELWAERDRALELWDAVLAAGQPAGLKVIGMDALDLLRIEGGFIIGGVEYDATVSPYECGLGWSVALDKGEFQGRDALAADGRSARFRLASVVLESGGAAASGARLTADGAEAGLVTQSIASPYLGGQTLGLARVAAEHSKPGTAIKAHLDSGPVAGEIVRHPVYDPERLRAKRS